MKQSNRLESNVRGYSRSFPKTFNKAENASLHDEKGNVYTDFLAGAGSLNYGHNNPVLKKALSEYIDGDGIVHGLDMATSAKEEFIQTFDEKILKPRDLDYKLQFTGPTGTNAVEAALKIARKKTGRKTIVSFTNAFHGVTMGSLAMTANSHYRNGLVEGPGDTVFMPYDGYLGKDFDSTLYLEKCILDSSSGMSLPAAVIVETIQGEGGINVARMNWLRSLEQICRKHDILLIVDDIQMGCGRTGSFFSFANAEIEPDIITLSKSLSGYGLPLSIVLLKPEHDIWEPGEHNGTFRGNNLAFVTAKAAIDEYWQSNRLSKQVKEHEKTIKSALSNIIDEHSDYGWQVRGRGMIQGLDVCDGETASIITEKAFKMGLIIETSGAKGQVIKVMPPLTIGVKQLSEGLKTLEISVAKARAMANA